MVHSGHYNRTHRLGGLKATENVFLTVWRAGKSKIKVPVDLVSGESLLPRWPSTHCVHGRRGMGSLWGLSLSLFFFCLGLYPWHKDIPRLGVQLELQLPVYTTATTTWDPSHICNPQHGSQQRRIPDPLREARDLTRILMDTSWICFC